MNKKYLKSAEGDDDFVFTEASQLLGFSVKTKSLRNFTVHINQNILGADYYSRIFDLFLEAEENDNINLFIASNGGNLDGLFVLLEGIRLTEAHVTAILIGGAHSAASILALNCHDIIVTDSASMLTHNIRTGFGGKIADLEAFTNFNRKISNKLIKDTYEGFLDPTELQEVLHGKEMWLDSDQIRERLEHRQAYLEAKFQAEQQAVETPPEPKPARKRKSPVEA